MGERVVVVTDSTADLPADVVPAGLRVVPLAVLGVVAKVVGTTGFGVFASLGKLVLTVALGVFRSQTPAGSPDWAGLMAAVLIAALPLLILFFAFANKVVNSIGFSGMK